MAHLQVLQEGKQERKKLLTSVSLVRWLANERRPSMADGRKSLLNISKCSPGSIPMQQELDRQNFLNNRWNWILKTQRFFLWGNKSNLPGELSKHGDGVPVAPQAPGIQRENADTVIQDTAQIQLSFHTSQHTAVSVHSSCG